MISVIVPNFNYAHRLKDRLHNILNQTVKPAEIIFLDDCSSDDSVAIAQETLSTGSVPYKIVTNKNNEGVFKQWIKGISLVQHDLFWIAEADDFCELNFIELMLPVLLNPDIVLAYCQSRFVTLDGEFLSHEYTYKEEYFDNARWQNSYCISAAEEIQNYLSVLNTIPNVSAVIFRKSNIDLAKIEQVSSYKMAGDWLFYILALNSLPGNKIYYVSAILNHYVRHKDSVFGNPQKGILLNEEVLSIYYYIINNFQLMDEIKNKIYSRVFQWVSFFDYSIKSQQLLFSLVSLFNDKNFIQEIKELLNNKDAEINRLNTTLNNKDVEINRLNITLNNKDIEIKYLNDLMCIKISKILKKIVTRIRFLWKK